MKLSVAERIKKLREIKKITQQEMADIIGIKRQHLSRVEKSEGGLSFEQLDRTAEAYNVNLNWLVRGEGEMFVSPVLEEGEAIRELNRVRRLMPKLDELLTFIEENPKRVSTLEKYHKIAISQSKLFEEISSLPEKQIERKLKLMLELIKG